MTKREFKRKYWYPISVDIERALRKLRIRVDNWYRKNWSIVFAMFVVFVVGCTIPLIKHDLDHLLYIIKLDKQVNVMLDEPFTDRYTYWRTDGSPGQDPPK
jgi:hypothetical protein